MIKKKILITGVAGFIGSNIANYLKKLLKKLYGPEVERPVGKPS